MSINTEKNLEVLKNTSYVFSQKGFDRETIRVPQNESEARPFQNDIQVNLVTLLKGFYALQMLEATSDVDSSIHSHNRWWNDFKSLRDFYYERLALMIYDYSVLALFGEMRHGRYKCHMYVDTDYFDKYGSGPRSNFTRGNKIPYSASSIVSISKKLFRYGWQSGYGGEAWGKIADAQDLYIKGQEAIYIDHCVDLQHNGGYYFNKELIFHMDGDLANYLDTKFKGDRDEIFHLCPVREIQDLIIRANNLGIITPLEELFYFSIPWEVYREGHMCNKSYHMFFGDETSYFHSWMIMDFLKNYNPYQFGKIPLTKHDLQENSRIDEDGYRIKRRDDYYDERRRDA